MNRYQWDGEGLNLHDILRIGFSGFRLKANSVVVASETLKGDAQGRVWSFSLYRSQHEILTIFFFKFYFFTYLFIFALSLHCCIQAFSSCEEQGYSSLQCLGFSLWWFLLLCITGSRAWAQQLWSRDLVALYHMKSSQAEDQTRVSYIGRRILDHQESPGLFFKLTKQNSYSFFFPPFIPSFKFSFIWRNFLLLPPVP